MRKILVFFKNITLKEFPNWETNFVCEIGPELKRFQLSENDRSIAHFCETSSSIGISFSSIRFTLCRFITLKSLFYEYEDPIFKI